MIRLKDSKFYVERISDGIRLHFEIGDDDGGTCQPSFESVDLTLRDVAEGVAELEKDWEKHYWDLLGCDDE